MAYENLLGIFLALIGTILFNIAPIIQKDAVDKIDQINSKNMMKSFVSLLRNKRWLFGASLGIIGGFPYFFALQIAGALVVQPLMNFGFIAMIIFANRVLHEKINTNAKIAIFMMIIMPVFITLGQVPLPHMYSDPTNIIIFTIIIALVCLVLFLFARKIPILWAFGCGAAFGIAALLLQAWSLPLDFSAGLANLIDQALAGILVIIPCIIFNIISIFLGQIGLQRNTASKFNPINGTTNSIVSFIGSIFIFNQFPDVPVYYFIGFALGLIGVFILSLYQDLILIKRKSLFLVSIAFFISIVMILID
jgi:uncharacterized membrane protein